MFASLLPGAQHLGIGRRAVGVPVTYDTTVRIRLGVGKPACLTITSVKLRRIPFLFNNRSNIAFPLSDDCIPLG